MSRGAPLALAALLALAAAAPGRADVARAGPRPDAHTDAPADVLGQLADPAQEARAHALFRQVRCVVCQNESIDDSEAELAGDLRRIVREDIAAGRTDAWIRDFLVARYGAFVLLKPRLDAGNAVLWLGPFALLAAGAAAALLRRAPRRPEAPLTADERGRLEALRTRHPSALEPPHARRREGACGGSAALLPGRRQPLRNLRVSFQSPEPRTAPQAGPGTMKR